MYIKDIPISKIVIKPNRHILKMDSVAMLVKSIEIHEQLTPIIVRETKDVGTYELIAGRQRMEAMRQLGKTMITASVELDIDTPELSAEAMEIAENLHRSDLDILERADFEVKYETLYTRINEERKRQEREWDESHPAAAEVLIPVNNSQKSKTAKNPKGAGRKPGGIAKQARDTGRTRDEIRTYRQIAALPPEVKAAAKELGQSDSRKTLLAAAKEQDPEAQRAVIEAAAEAVKAPRTPAAVGAPPRLSLVEVLDWLDTASDEEHKDFFRYYAMITPVSRTLAALLANWDNEWGTASVDEKDALYDAASELWVRVKGH